MVAMAQLWWPLSPWLSLGAAWFIFFNAVVAAIAIMSSSREEDGHVLPSSRQRLCRSSSSAILDQLRSFSLFSIQPTAGGVTGPLLGGHGDVSDSDYYCSSQAEMASSPQVTHHASMVVRDTPRSTAPAAGESVVIPVCATPPPQCEAPVPAAADLASARESKDDEADAEEEQGKSISLDEAYAMIQHSRQRQPPSADSAPAAATISAAKKDLAAKAPKRRARSSGREAEATAEGKAELNARAELFIRQFREELKLQRLNSLLRHTHAFDTRDGAPTAAVR